MLGPFAVLAGTGVLAAGLGIAEARSVVRSDRDVALDDLPDDLVGLRIGHLSDLHLGAPGVNRTAAERGVALLVEARPDLIAITGDLLSHPRGADDLLRILEPLEAPLGVYAILGNHDVGEVRDPLSRPSEAPDLAPLGIRLLRDETVVVDRAGRTIAISGLEPRRPEGRPVLPPSGLPLVSPWPAADADLHIVLSHYPDAIDASPADARDLVLAGHIHGGQICLPWPGGRVRLANPRHPYPEGVYRRGRSVLHVTRGVGTTFVPFRILARPEVAVVRVGR